MNLPQTFLDAAQKLGDDADALGVAYADLAAKQQAEAEATHAREVADSAATAGASQLESDKAALKTLIDSLFPSTPPGVG